MTLNQKLNDFLYIFFQKITPLPEANKRFQFGRYAPPTTFGGG